MAFATNLSLSLFTNILRAKSGITQISKHGVSKVSFGSVFVNLGKRGNAGHEKTTVNKTVLIQVIFDHRRLT